MFQNKVVEAAEFKEVEIPGAADMKDGEKKELKVQEGEKGSILIVKYKGKLYAVGAYCTHFGVPMNFGVVIEDKLLCPAHGAAFSVTGEQEVGPAYDNLPKFEVIEKDG